jgi:hypothetical protein
MNARQYATEIVIPTVREALANRGDRRHQYLACITTYHLLDYVAHEIREPLANIRAQVAGSCSASLKVIEGVANGTKHAGNYRDAKRGKLFFKPGMERDIPIFAFDTPGAGWGEGRWDCPGLGIAIDGQELFVDTCVQVVLHTVCRRLYTHVIGDVDLMFLDAGLA